MADVIPILVDPNKEQSLKDAYAGYALAGLLAAKAGKDKIFETNNDVYKLVNAAWSIAELMIHARRGPIGPETPEKN